MTPNDSRHYTARACVKAFLAIALLFPTLLLQGCSADTAQASAIKSPARILARGVVDVEGGLVSIRAQRAGHLVAIGTALGGNVSRGQTLATLEGTAADAEVDVARAELQRARAELASATHRQHSLEEQMSRVREAVELGAESARVRDELQTQLDATISEVPVTEASVAAAEARLRGARISVDGALIRTPIDGRVVQVNAHVGDVVNPSEGSALFLVRPNTALIIRASIPERDASHIRVGSAASVTAMDADGPTYDGRVLFVGELARKPDPAFSADDFSSERIVDCILQLDPTAALRVGSVVMVSFQ